MLKNTSRIMAWGMLLAFALVSCTSNRTTPDYVTLLESGDGPAVADDYLVFMSMVVSNQLDSVLYDSRRSYQPPQPMLYLDSMAKTPSFEEAIGTMVVGDSAQITLAALDYFDPERGMRLPPMIDSADVLTFTIGIDSISDREAFVKKQKEQALQMRRMQMETMLADSAVQAQIAAETPEIEAYLEENNLTPTTTKPGVWVVVTEEGSGEVAEAGQTLGMKYSGRLLDNTYFDTNIEEVAKAQDLYQDNRPYNIAFEFKLLTGRVIPGWHMGIEGLKEGSEAILLIASPLAYGERGSGEVIPPNAPLRFDVEVVEVKE